MTPEELLSGLPVKQKDTFDADSRFDRYRPVTSKYDATVEKYAAQYGPSQKDLHALAKAVMLMESQGDPNAESSAGAKGLMQVTDATYREMGGDPAMAFDPEDNIHRGVKYLSQQLDKYGDPKLALAAYNAGPGNVDNYGGVPPFSETKNYVKHGGTYFDKLRTKSDAEKLLSDLPVKGSANSLLSGLPVQIPKSESQSPEGVTNFADTNPDLQKEIDDVRNLGPAGAKALLQSGGKNIPPFEGYRPPGIIPNVNAPGPLVRGGQPTQLASSGPSGVEPFPAELESPTPFVNAPPQLNGYQPPAKPTAEQNLQAAGEREPASSAQFGGGFVKGGINQLSGNLAHLPITEKEKAGSTLGSLAAGAAPMLAGPLAVPIMAGQAFMNTAKPEPGTGEISNPVETGTQMFTQSAMGAIPGLPGKGVLSKALGGAGVGASGAVVSEVVNQLAKQGHLDINDPEAVKQAALKVAMALGDPETVKQIVLQSALGVGFAAGHGGEGAVKEIQHPSETMTAAQVEGQTPLQFTPPPDVRSPMRQAATEAGVPDEQVQGLENAMQGRQFGAMVNKANPEFRAQDLPAEAQAIEKEPTPDQPSTAAQLTRAQYYDALYKIAPDAPRSAFTPHDQIVEDAINNDQSVPPEVMKDYPHLQALKEYLDLVGKAKEGGEEQNYGAEADDAFLRYVDLSRKNSSSSSLTPFEDNSLNEGQGNPVPAVDNRVPPPGDEATPTGTLPTRQNLPSLSTAGEVKESIPQNVSPTETEVKPPAYMTPARFAQAKAFLSARGGTPTDREIISYLKDLGNKRIPEPQKNKSSSAMSLINRENRSREIKATDNLLRNGDESIKTTQIPARALPKEFDIYGTKMTRVKTRDPEAIRYKDDKGKTYDFHPDDMVHTGGEKISKGEPFLDEHGTLHDEDGNPLFQKSESAGIPEKEIDNSKSPKGSYHTEAGKAVVTFFKGKADLSTVIHEVFHAVEQGKGIITEEHRAILAADLEKLGIKNPINDKGVFTQEAAERTARWFERYMRDGKTPFEDLKPVFAKIKQWMSEIYHSVIGSPIEKEIPPATRKVFDEWFKKVEEPQKVEPAPAAKPKPMEAQPETLDKLFQKDESGNPADNDLSKYISQNPKDPEDKSGFLSGWEKHYTDWIEGATPLFKVQDIFEKESGEKLPPEKNLKYLVDRTRGAGGIANQFIDEKLAPLYKNLSIEQTHALDEYLISKRSVWLYENKEGYQDAGLPKDKAEQALQKLQERPDFKKIAERAQGVWDYNKAIADAKMNSGIWTPEERAVFAKEPYYVPFQRDRGSAGLKGGFKGGSGKAYTSTNKMIMRIAGTKVPLPIIEPLRAMVAQTHEAASEIAKSKVWNAVVDLTTSSKELQEWIHEVPKAEDGKAVEGTVSVIRDGVRKSYLVPQELADAVNNLGITSLPDYMRTLTRITSLFKRFATGWNVDFAINNLFRDQQEAAVNSGAVPFVSALKGISHYLKKDAVYQHYLKSGGGQDMVESGMRKAGDKAEEIRYNGARFGKARDPQAFRDNEKLQRFLEVAKKIGKAPIDLAEFLGEASEMATRLGTFEAALKKHSVQEATHIGRQSTIDFSRMGKKMRQYNQVIPFLNAGVQGVDRLVRTAKDHPVAFTARWLTYGFLPMAGLLAWNYKNPYYAAIPNREKENDWILMLNGHGPQYIKIAKSGAQQVLINGFQMALEKHLKTAYLSNTDLAAGVVGAISPVSDASALIPVPLRIVAEEMANYDLYWDKSIVKDPTLPAKYQYNPNTSETIKKIGFALNISPSRLEHIARGVMAGTAGNILFATDLALGKTGLAKDPEWKPERTPIIRRLYGVAEGWKSDLAQKQIELTNKIRGMKREGFSDIKRRAANENPGFLPGVLADYSKQLMEAEQQLMAVKSAMAANEVLINNLKPARLALSK